MKCSNCEQEITGRIWASGPSVFCTRRCRDTCRHGSRKAEARPRAAAARRCPQSQGRRVERDAMSRRGARQQPGSGSDVLRPGDGLDADFLYECKFTTHNSFRLTREIWSKVEKESIVMGRMPALLLDINGLKLMVVRDPHP